jgi:rubrerythrin
MKKIVEPIEPDEEDYLDEFDELRGPDYYYCNGCGYSTITYYGSWGCPRCGAIMEEEYY